VSDEKREADLERKRVTKMWNRMAADCGRLLSGYKAHCHSKARGIDIVRALLAATARAQPLPTALSPDLPGIQHFQVKLHERLPTSNVLVLGEGDERILRVAPSDRPEDLNLVGHALLRSAKSRTNSRKRYIAADASVGGDKDRPLSELWRLRKADPVLQQVLRAWKRLPGNAGLGDYHVLDHLQALMNEAKPVRTYAPNPQHTNNRHPIELFALRVPGIAREIRVLRRLDGTRLADVHIAPIEDWQLLGVLDQMGRSEIKSESIRQALQAAPETEGERPLRYVNGPIVKQLKEAFEAFQRARQGSYKARHGAAAFVEHLNALCEAAGRGVLVDKASNIRRYIVLPEGSAKPVTLLRRTDERGLAAIRRIRADLSDQAEVVKQLLQRKHLSARRIELRMEAVKATGTASAPRLSPSTEPAGSNARVPQEASELVDLLERVLENKRQGKALLEGVAQATGIPDTEARAWLNADGTLKRSVYKIPRLRGYFELRDELCGLLADLGDTNPQRLPGRPTAAHLVRVLEARIERPEANLGELAHITSLNVEALRTSFTYQDVRLKSGNGALRMLVDYCEHRDALQDAIARAGDLERAATLPVAETPAETFLRRLEGQAYALRLVMSELQADPTLDLAEAVARVSVSIELKDVARRVIGPGGVLRPPDEIVEDLPGLNQALQAAVQPLLAQIAQPPRSNGLSVQLLRRRGPYPAKLVLVNETREAPKSGPAVDYGRRNPTDLEGLYANSPRLIVPPRSFRHERLKQVLRWLSTVIKSQFQGAREVQAYWDTAHGELWLASNISTINRKIADFLANGGLRQMLQEFEPDSFVSREARHAWKLRRLLVDEEPGAAAARPLLAALANGKIRVPTETVIGANTGVPIELHAERRIKRAFEAAHRDEGLKMNWKLVAGTMRPCGTCAKDLGLPANAHRGPFWVSHAGREGYDLDQVIRENIEASIGTFATRTIGGKLNVTANTDSDSDAQGHVHDGRPGKRKVTFLRPAPAPKRLPMPGPSSSAGEKSASASAPGSASRSPTASSEPEAPAVAADLAFLNDHLDPSRWAWPKG